MEVRSATVGKVGRDQTLTAASMNRPGMKFEMKLVL